MLAHTLNMPFLAQAENRDTFFTRIGQFLPSLDSRFREIERAYNVAKDAFREVVRSDGDRYFEHLRAVALIQVEYMRIRDHHLIIAGLLHDTVEDKPEWTIERISSEFGREVATLIEYLTIPSEEFGTKEEREYIYHARFRFAPRDFWKVKLPDRLHNILTIDGRPHDKRMAKIEETRRYYLPYAEEQCLLIQELEHGLALAEALDARAEEEKKK